MTASRLSTTILQSTRSTFLSNACEKTEQKSNVCIPAPEFTALSIPRVAGTGRGWTFPSPRVLDTFLPAFRRRQCCEAVRCTLIPCETTLHPVPRGTTETRSQSTDDSFAGFVNGTLKPRGFLESLTARLVDFPVSARGRHRRVQ